MTADEIFALPPLKWTVRNVLPVTGIAAMFGPSGSGKSFLALDLMGAIADGRDWFSHKVVKTPVVYVCLEGEGGLSKRLKAYRTKYGETAGADIRFVTADFNLLKVDYVRALIRAVREANYPGALVVIDTLNRATPGADENSSEDMGLAIEGTKALQKYIGGLVVLIHHTGKDASRGMRGHSSLFAALDAAVEVFRNGDERGWSIAKSKDGEDGKEFPFKLEVINLGLETDGDDLSSITSCVINVVEGEFVREKRLTPKQQQGMNSLVKACHEFGTKDADGVWGVDGEDWREVFYQSSTADNVEAKKKALQRLRDALVTGGFATVKDDRYSPSDPDIQASITFTLRGRDSGTGRDICGTCPDDETGKRDGTGHTTIGVSHVPPGRGESTAEKQPPAASSEAISVAPDVPAAKLLSISEVRPKVLAKSSESPELDTQVKALLEKFGSGKLTDVPPKFLGELLAEVEAL